MTKVSTVVAFYSIERRFINWPLNNVLRELFGILGSIWCHQVQIYKFQKRPFIEKMTIKMAIEMYDFSHPGLTLLLASWLPCQNLTKFLIQHGNHGFHGKILTKILPRNIIIPRSNLTKMEKILRFQIIIKSSKVSYY